MVPNLLIMIIYYNTWGAVGGTSGSSLPAWLVEEREEQSYFEVHYSWRKREFQWLLDGSWYLLFCGIKNGLGSKLCSDCNYFNSRIYL